MADIKIVRARSTEEYVNMIEQAIDDTFDLRQAFEFDSDDLGDVAKFVDPLESGLKEIYQSMKDGTYQFSTGDLPFMSILNEYHDSMIPFKYLLLRINATHMKGLEIDSGMTL